MDKQIDILKGYCSYNFISDLLKLKEKFPKKQLPDLIRELIPSYKYESFIISLQFKFEKHKKIYLEFPERMISPMISLRIEVAKCESAVNHFKNQLAIHEQKLSLVTSELKSKIENFKQLTKNYTTDEINKRTLKEVENSYKNKISPEIIEAFVDQTKIYKKQFETRLREYPFKENDYERTLEK